MERLEEYKHSSTKLEQTIDNVRMSLRLHIQKHNKPYCHEAEGFIQTIMAYTPLIIPEKVKEFEFVLRKYVYDGVVLPETFDKRDLWNRTIKEAEEINTLSVVDDLYQFIDSCSIMKKWSDTHSWEEIDKVLEKQGHSGFTFSAVANMMIKYSDMGVDFVDRYCPKRLENDENFAEIYNKAKARLQTKQEEDVMSK